MANPYRAHDVEFPPTADETNLRLLSIFHYVVAGFIAFFSSLFIFYVVFGARLLAETSGGDSTVAGFFIGTGSVAVLFGWTMAALTALAGRSLTKRRRHLFCIVVASISCLWMPFGTLLGVFTLVVLSKPHVKAMFQRPEAEANYSAVS